MDDQKEAVRLNLYEEKILRSTHIPYSSILEETFNYFSKQETYFNFTSQILLVWYRFIQI